MIKLGTKVKIKQSSHFFDQAPNQVGIIFYRYVVQGNIWYRVKFASRKDSYPEDCLNVLEGIESSSILSSHNKLLQETAKRKSK